ncbi:DUF6279 domain-containing protein [Cupriavidus respiraculi]|uniref:Lipoprotein n=2 Tax=Cupriavidus respiraculi TaxID=195930 RepID=A0ABN7YQ87_9BURK|nr:hypothetical protein LMG21510_02917 [Cupriavidus respiraculi]
MRGDSNMGGLRRLRAVTVFHDRGGLRKAAAMVAALALALLAGCNAMKLGYQQGDHLAYWWIDNYVDVTDDQEAQTRDAINRFFAWHRKDQLPEIATALRRAKAQVQQPVTAAQVEQIQDEAQRLGREAYDHALPDVADLLVTLTPEQITRMERKFADGNAKYRKKFLRGSPEQRLEARYDKVMEYAKLIYGRFSREQEAAIREAVRPVVDGADTRFAEREKRQQAWLALARQVQAERPPKARVMELLKRFGDQWQAPPSRDRQSTYEANNNAGVALAVTVANLTTPEQKRHAADRFQGWIDDTNALMREAPRQGTAAAAGSRASN